MSLSLRPLALACLCVLAVGAPAPALAPQDVYIVTNRNVPESRAIAEHYCQKRGVPRDHILVLELPTGEDISRGSYEKDLAGPLRRLLDDRRGKATVLLTVYGVPLRVGGDHPSARDKEEADRLKKDIASLEKRKKDVDEAIQALEEKKRSGQKGQTGKELSVRKKEQSQLAAALQGLRQQRRWMLHEESGAAVDSELALLWHGSYELRRWRPNPLYFQITDEARKRTSPVLMTCRLDGPSVELVKRLVDQAGEVEKKGLQGKVYVDARGIPYNPAKDNGLAYGGYDESLREMARLLERQGDMTVVLDDRPKLFEPGSCPDCALYCGWYSLAKYVDCCRFVPGAVAYHIASSEAVSLRDPRATYWCKNLLEKGAIATLGPVAEPYTLVECYWRSQMLASWMTVLVGDPLYNPFARAPKLKVDQVKPSPRGGNPFQLLDLR